MNTKYEPIGKAPHNITSISLQQARFMLGPADEYHIYAGAYEYLRAKELQQMWMGGAQGNPFSPIINVMMDPELEKEEWYVKAIRHGHNKDAVGSNGRWPS